MIIWYLISNFIVFKNILRIKNGLFNVIESYEKRKTQDRTACLLPPAVHTHPDSMGARTFSILEMRQCTHDHSSVASRKTISLLQT